jgi:hypothetical protein
MLETYIEYVQIRDGIGILDVGPELHEKALQSLGLG